MAKRALCIGIDRFSVPNIPPLHGCVNDARAVARLLVERLGFSAGDVKDLHNERATKENILRSVDWLRQVSSPGDEIVLYVATHGTFFPDRSGNEADGMDEVVVVYDHNWQWNLLRDDELAEQLARFPVSVQVVCIFDASHATMVRSPGRAILPPPELPPIGWARSRNLGTRGRLRHRRADDLPGVLLISACAEHEEAVEVAGPSGHGGAFTLALLEALGRCQGAESWEQLVAQAGNILQARGVRQTPQVHGPASMRNRPVLGASAAPQPAWAGAASAPWQGAASQQAPGGVPQPGAQQPWASPSASQPWAAPGAPYSPPQPYGQPPAPSWGASAQAASLGAAAVGAGAMMTPQGGQPLATLNPQSAMPMVDTSLVTPVDAALNAFNPNDYTVKLCNTIFRILPFAPKPLPYANLADAVQAFQPGPTGDVLHRAQQYASTEEVKRTLWVAGAIDTGDAGIAVYSGVRSAVVLFFGENKSDALETDPQQAVDAAMKLLAMCYIIYKLFPGPVPDRVRTFYTLPAGQSLAMYYAAIEIGLPFADNVARAGGHFVHNLYQRYGSDAASKLSSMIGRDDVENSSGILQSIMSPMESAVQQITPYAQQIADGAKAFVPGAMNVADKVAGVVATGADALPVYKYLVARLVAEACAATATRG